MRVLPALLILLAALAAVLLWVVPSGKLAPGAGSQPAALAAAESARAASPARADLDESAPQGARQALPELAAPAGADGSDSAATATLLLRLVDARGLPAAGAGVRVQYDARQEEAFPGPLGARFHRQLGRHEEEAEGEAVPAASDGTVRLPGIEPWRDLVLLAGGPHWVAQEVQVSRLAPGETRDVGSVPLAPGCRVYGRVVGPDGKGLAGADVRVSAPQAPGGIWLGDAKDAVGSVTDEEGSFEIQGVPPGRHVLTARASGYATTRRDPFLVDPEVRDLPLQLRVEPGLAVRGVVLDQASGKPLPEARVQVLQRRAPFDGGFVSSSSLLEEGHAVGPDGRFVLGGLSGTGDESVAAAAPGYAMSVSQPVRPGGEIQLRLAPEYALCGRVLSPSGEPVEGAQIQAQRSGSQFPLFRGAESAADGSFEMKGLAEGPYAVSIASPSGSAEVPLVQVGPDTPPLEVRLAGGAAFVVQVADESGAAVPDATVALSTEEQQVLFGDDGDETGSRVAVMGGRLPLRRRTDGSGTASFEALPAGQWKLRVEKKGHAPASRYVERPAPAEQVVSVVLARAAMLRVQVVDSRGEPVARARVRLDPVGDWARADEEEPLARSTTAGPSDAQGWVSWQALPPGDYEARAESGGDDESWGGFGRFVLRLDGEDEEAPSPGAGGLPLTLAPGQLTEARLVVAELALPRVRVTRLGQPVAGARVSARPGAADAEEDGFFRIGIGFDGTGAVTDGAGWATLSPSPPGKYTLEARARAASPATEKEVELIPGPQLVHLDLATGEVRGMVTGAGGPVAGAKVVLLPAPAAAAEEGEDGEQRSMRGVVVVSAISDGGTEPIIESFSTTPGQSTTATGADGSFVFEDVPEGSYRVRVEARNHAAWTSGSFYQDGRSLVDQGVVTLRGAGALAGTVMGLETRPGEFGWQTVQLERDGGEETYFSLVGKDGRYQFQDLTPGTYRLSTFLRGRKVESDRISVEEGRQAEYHFRLPAE